MAEASAPASSANLGPGFDTLALALELRCRVMAEPAAAWQVEHEGRMPPVPLPRMLLLPPRSWPLESIVLSISRSGATSRWREGWAHQPPCEPPERWLRCGLPG